MTSLLVLYWSRRGHTAKIARHVRDGAIAAGARADALDLRDAMRTGVDWDRYDVVALGAPVIYGTYDKPFLRFVAANRTRLDAKANSFFNVSVVARTPEKARVEGNRYMQKFLELSPWKPKDLKVIAGKVDYPAWRWYEVFMIRLIMKYTDGPTDRLAVIDYTNWDDVAAYGRHLVTLASASSASPTLSTSAESPAPSAR
jgi:menaquinone-dependent protoporphyrinogen oxidase